MTVEMELFVFCNVAIKISLKARQKSKILDKLMPNLIKTDATIVQPGLYSCHICQNIVRSYGNRLEVVLNPNTCGKNSTMLTCP